MMEGFIVCQLHAFCYAIGKTELILEGEGGRGGGGGCLSYCLQCLLHTLAKDSRYTWSLLGANIS